MRFLSVTIFLLPLFISSCGANNEQLTSKSDTTISPKQIKPKDKEQTELTAEDELELRAIQKRQAEKEEIEKYAGEEYKSGNEMEVVESKIVYDENFLPYAVVTIKNNLTIPFIAYEIIIRPTDKLCGTVAFQKKNNISAQSTITIKQLLSSKSTYCFDNSSVSLGNCIMKTGKKLNLGDIFRNVKGVGE